MSNSNRNASIGQRPYVGNNLEPDDYAEKLSFMKFLKERLNMTERAVANRPIHSYAIASIDSTTESNGKHIDRKSTTKSECNCASSVMGAAGEPSKSVGKVAGKHYRKAGGKDVAQKPKRRSSKFGSKKQKKSVAISDKKAKRDTDAKKKNTEGQPADQNPAVDDKEDEKPTFQYNQIPRIEFGYLKKATESVKASAKEPEVTPKPWIVPTGPISNEFMPVLYHEPFNIDKPWTFKKRDPSQYRPAVDGHFKQGWIDRYEPGRQLVLPAEMYFGTTTVSSDEETELNTRTRNMFDKRRAGAKAHIGRSRTDLTAVASAPGQGKGRHLEFGQAGREIITPIEWKSVGGQCGMNRTQTQFCDESKFLGKLRIDTRFREREKRRGQEKRM